MHIRSEEKNAQRDRHRRRLTTAAKWGGRERRNNTKYIRRRRRHFPGTIKIDMHRQSAQNAHRCKYIIVCSRLESHLAV